MCATRNKSIGIALGSITKKDFVTCIVQHLWFQTRIYPYVSRSSTTSRDHRALIPSKLLLLTSLVCCLPFLYNYQQPLYFVYFVYMYGVFVFLFYIISDAHVGT